MLSSKRSIVLSSVLALLIYLVPNLVQDIHRISGEHQQSTSTDFSGRLQWHTYNEKCLVCVFEFNVIDELTDSIFVPLVQPKISLLTENRRDQLYNSAFHYYNLRAPPQVC